MVQDSKILGLLEAGMRAEGLRQQAIANNVANMQTSGYRRQDVNFSDVLSRAVNGRRSLDPASLEFELYQPGTTPINASGSDVSLDSEVGEMIKNSIRHRTFTLLMKKRYQQMEAAMRTQ